MARLPHLRALANAYMPDAAILYRPDYAGSASPTTIATTTCRVVRYAGGGVNALDATGEATHTIHLPAGVDTRSGDEILVNAAERYAVIATNGGRSLDFDTQAAVKRIA